MRQALIILLIATFCFCKQRSGQSTSIQDSATTDSADTPVTKRTEHTTTELTMLQWEKQEDSLRTVILRRKDNESLKNSFLQEMYIRNVVRLLKDSLLVNIPFDLHGPDGGAPDCYSTNISFSFNFGDTLIFPENLQVQEYEYGCIDKEKRLRGTFQLIEQTDKYIIYHSGRYKRTLVLFSSNKENGTAAYYFTDVEQNRINGKNVDSIEEAYDEEGKNAIYPFTSWILTTNEYENFLPKSNKKT